MLNQKIFFIFLPSFLTFSMYDKFSVINRNVFITLLLASYDADQVDLFKEIFYITYFKGGTFLHFIGKTFFNHFSIIQAVLLLYTPENSVFTDSLCILGILSIIVLNVSTSKVQKNFYDNILLKCEKILDIFAPTFFILVALQFNTFFIPMFYAVIFIMFFTNLYSCCSTDF